MAGLVVFLASFLLFSVELLLGKAALPRFGGSPAVWVTSLCFFQVALLLGYAWAGRLSVTALARQHRLHGGLLGLAIVWLVVQVAVWGAPLVPPWAAQGQTVSAMASFLGLSIAGPFVALAATAPLVQGWVARAGLAPWRLYALSNVGAFAALLLYPFAVEPRMGLSTQAWVWSALYVGLAIAVIRLGASTASKVVEPAAEVVHSEKTTPAQWLAWSGLAALGTALLGAVSNVLCQDLSAGPLVWTLPLGVYLASFVIAFEKPSTHRPVALLVLTSLGTAVCVIVAKRGDFATFELLGAYLAVQLFASLFVHGELYRLKPAPAALGSYYLALAAGGAVGSLVVALAAPAWFDEYFELPAAVVGISLVGLVRLARRPDEMKMPVFVVRVGLALLQLVLAMVLWISWDFRPDDERTRLRNFYGVLHVAERDPGTPDHRRTLVHGDILHGEQSLAPGRENDPISYFGRTSGLGRAIQQLHGRGVGQVDATILGLGIGSAALLFEAGDKVTYYEIDHDVVRLAQGDGGHFDLLARSRAQIAVREGDARDQLQKDMAGDWQAKDLLAVDVFSGDAVPAHLLTSEAIALYARAIKPDGVLALHLSNRHLSLWRVAFPAVREAGLSSRLFISPTKGLEYEAAWLVATRDAALLDRMTNVGGWSMAGVDTYGAQAWTDDRSSLLDVWR